MIVLSTLLVIALAFWCLRALTWLWDEHQTVYHRLVVMRRGPLTPYVLTRRWTQPNHRWCWLWYCLLCGAVYGIATMVILLLWL